MDLYFSRIMHLVRISSSRLTNQLYPLEIDDVIIYSNLTVDNNSNPVTTYFTYLSSVILVSFFLSRWFWKALEEFSSDEQALYLRFVWGRSRLPLSTKDFGKKHTINAQSLPFPDTKLPSSHTCTYRSHTTHYDMFIHIVLSPLRLCCLCYD